MPRGKQSDLFLRSGIIETMKGRKPYGPRFTIKERAHFLNNKKAKPVDRSDRFNIDYWNLKIFWSVETLKKDFIARAEKVRSVLNIPELEKNADRYYSQEGIHSSLFAPKILYIGVNSSFLRHSPETAKRLEKAIYNNFLLPYGWSFNFYPFIECYILYGQADFKCIKPNPKQFQLIMKHKKELGRNRYTKSDIAFLKQQALIEYSENPRRKRDIDIIANGITLLKNNDRRPKNPELKIAAFLEFNKIHDEDQLNRKFLFNRIYSIKNEDLNPQEEKKLLSQVKKLYSEYKKVIHSI